MTARASPGIILLKAKGQNLSRARSLFLGEQHAHQEPEDTMKAISLLLVTSISCLAIADAAVAGQCTTDIEQLQKKLSTTDAGMGPTAATGAAQTVTPQVPATGTGTPVTTGTSNALQGKAASPSDVAQQNQGQPTAADAALAGKPASLDKRTAQESLDRARKFDEAGKETECQAEITKAKAAFGAQ
jgi:hypothetical protein